MAYFRILFASLFGLLFTKIHAQQLSGAWMNVTYPGLSNSCQNALNTSVSCPMFLSPVSYSGAILGTDEVTALCVDSCYTSLESARTTIAGACTASTDIIVNNNVAYPATFLADNFLFTYNVSCRKDSTGAFCDPQILSWSNQTYLTSAQNCSDCWLGGQSMLLSSPLGYNTDLASNLASLTSSCSAKSYAFATPTSYALNSTATTQPATVTATAPPTCTGSYVVKANDNCNAVAKSLNVSTYSLLYQNNLDLYCQNFATMVGSSLCIPPQCNTYTWQAFDSCNSVVSSLTGVTVPQFLSWNPNFNSLCQNSLAFVGYTVCLSPPGGYLNYTSSGNGSVTTSASVAAPVPTNAMTGSNRDCGAWYTVKAGDDCAHVSLANGISLQDFYFLNPEINVNCTNLLLDIDYCVEPVGSVSTYSGYPITTPLITVPPASFTSVNTAIPTVSSNPGFTYTYPLLPEASGTVQGCENYLNGNDTSSPACSAVASLWDITTTELLAWNPSLPSNLSTCSLQSTLSYCVYQTVNSTTQTPPWCMDTTATDAGTASNCNCFTEIHGYQNTTYTCADLEEDVSVTEAQLLAWNTWMGSSCSTGLYANLNYSSIRAVCIGVSGSSSSTSTTTSTPTSTTSTMGPTPTDTVPGCLEFYTVQSGDQCQTILDKFSITLAQFYAWNPSVGSGCTNLWLEEAYCVKGPSATTTSVSTTTTSSGPTGPTQSGIVANCNKWYTVVSGDSCSKVESLYSITFAQLLAWNPAIGSNCQYLDIGDSYCVGVSS